MKDQYILKGMTKCYIQHDGLWYKPDSEFYAEVTKEECDFLSQFLYLISITEKENEGNHDPDKNVSSPQTKRRYTKK